MNPNAILDEIRAVRDATGLAEQGVLLKPIRRRSYEGFMGSRLSENPLRRALGNDPGMSQPAVHSRSPGLQLDAAVYDAGLPLT